MVIARSNGFRKKYAVLLYFEVKPPAKVAASKSFERCLAQKAPRQLFCLFSYLLAVLTAFFSDFNSRSAQVEDSTFCILCLSFLLLFLCTT